MVHASASLALPAVHARQDALRARFPTWSPQTLDGLLKQTSALFPKRPFVVTDQQTWTYQDMLDWSSQIAAGLIHSGVQPGDHVALLMANYPAYVAVKFAIAMAGAVAVPLNFLNRRDELSYLLKQSDAVLLITMDGFRNLDYQAFLDELAPGWETLGGGTSFPKLKQVVVLNTGECSTPRPNTSSLNKFGQGLRLPLVQHPGPHSNSDIIYTSGTTGAPKGVMLTHDMMLRTAFGSAWGRAFEDGRRILFSLPLYHVYGYVEGLLACMFVGGAIVPQTKFDAVQTLEGIESYQATDVLLIPTMTLSLIDELKKTPRSLRSLHSVISSGGRAPASIWGDIQQHLHPEEITTGYGMTEVTASSTVTRPDDGMDKWLHTNGRLRDVGPAGDPALGQRLVAYRVVDPDTGRLLPSGEVGELQARGPGVTAGYYNKPEATQAAFTADGWLHTGDLGRIDQDNYLSLVGRLKESYRCGGEQVMPTEAEDLLISHPAVLQAHVVPVPDTRMGEVGVACVVLRDNLVCSKEELQQLCAERLARFKVPKHFLFMNTADVPVTPSGRARKFLLVQVAMKALGLSTDI